LYYFEQQKREVEGEKRENGSTASELEGSNPSDFMFVYHVVENGDVLIDSEPGSDQEEENECSVLTAEVTAGTAAPVGSQHWAYHHRKLILCGRNHKKSPQPNRAFLAGSTDSRYKVWFCYLRHLE
jgi:hypothetical protein